VLKIPQEFQKELGESSRKYSPVFWEAYTGDPADRHNIRNQFPIPLFIKNNKRHSFNYNF